MDAGVLVEASGVCKKFCRDLRRALRYGLQEVFDELFLRRRQEPSLREDEFWAIDQVSFQLRQGESLGVVGHNGAGKSTLLKLLIGRLKLTRGQITTRGRIVALTELGLGFDPVLSGRENAYINAAVLGVSRQETTRIMDDIIDFSGLGEFIDAPVQTYSSGMRARLGFSVAAHLEPDIMLVDEVLRVGDMVFKHKCVRRIKKYLDDGGSLILVSHDPYLVQSLCDRCLVIDRGRLMFEGPSVEGISFYCKLGHDMEHEEAVQRAQRQMSAQTEAGATAEDQIQVVGEEEPTPESADDAAGLEPAGEPLAAVPETPDGPPAPERQPGSAEAETPAPPAPSMTGSHPDVFTPPELSEEVPVVIDDVVVTPVEDDKFETGKPARVIVHYRAAQTVDAAWAFLFLTADLMITVTSCTRGLDSDSVVLAPGKGTLNCLIPSLPLRAGAYAIRAGIADAVTGCPLAQFGWDEAPRLFTVESEASRATNAYSAIGDLVQMSVVWED